MDAEAMVALLRRFEPVLRFTGGERFFPMDVAAYARACSLWSQRPDAAPVLLTPRGALTLDGLADLPPLPADAITYLRLVDPGADRAHPRPPEEGRFRAGRGRLARVGYVARIVDALFTLSLLVRGRVPAVVAAAAAARYEGLPPADRVACYHGRAVRQGPWLVLQYWFFFAYNNWRTGFAGANDHEADWELVSVYLAEGPDGALAPEWAAFAAHNEAGGDLRRRWDDPELETIGEHPVVYVGAGSHAGYFRAGEYLTEVELRVWSPLARAARIARGFWRRALRQYAGEEGAPERRGGLFAVPFVDFARGDGRAIGPGQGSEWGAPRLLEPAPGWVTNYRGRFGLYARDPFAGEDAPAGPMYRGDGGVRLTWHDPVGWAGLDATPPATAALPLALARLAALEERRADLRAALAERDRRLAGLGLDLAALRGGADQRGLHDALRARFEETERERDRLAAELAENEALGRALEDYAARLQVGEREPARAHLRRPATPTSPGALRLGRIAEVWAAASIGLLLLAVAVLAEFARELALVALLPLLALFVLLEASFRGWVARLVTVTAVALALASALVLIYQFALQVAIFTVLGVAVFILWQNLRELFG